MAKIEELHDTGKREADFHAVGVRLLDLRRCQAFRLEELKRRLAAREGVAGMEKNCEALRQEIARLEGSTNGNP